MYRIVKQGVNEIYHIEKHMFFLGWSWVHTEYSYEKAVASLKRIKTGTQNTVVYSD